MKVTLSLSDQRIWAGQQHERVNHLYGDLPYLFHLDAVEVVHRQFKDEAPKEIHSDIISKACYGHDLEEDCRLTYNDIKAVLGEPTAEIVHALTNSKGRTRAERADSNYYHNIRLTPGASFVKICDRIANVRFSRLTGSKMFETYRKENVHFIENVNAKDYPAMKKELENMFDND